MPCWNCLSLENSPDAFSQAQEHLLGEKSQVKINSRTYKQKLRLTRGRRFSPEILERYLQIISKIPFSQVQQKPNFANNSKHLLLTALRSKDLSSLYHDPKQNAFTDCVLRSFLLPLLHLICLFCSPFTSFSLQVNLYSLIP